MTMTADEFQRHQDLSMTEAQFEAWLAGICKRNGLYRYHPLRSKGSQSGWPDDAIINGDTLHLWENKAERGKLTVAQREVGELLKQVKYVDYQVMRPSDMPRMREELGAIL